MDLETPGWISTDCAQKSPRTLGPYGGRTCASRGGRLPTFRLGITGAVDDDHPGGPSKSPPSLVLTSVAWDFLMSGSFSLLACMSRCTVQSLLVGLPVKKQRLSIIRWDRLRVEIPAFYSTSILPWHSWLCFLRPLATHQTSLESS